MRFHVGRQLLHHVEATKHERRQCRRRLTQLPASKCASTAVAGDSSPWCTSLLGLIHVFNMGSMKQMRALLHNKNHMSAHHMTPSSVTSES